MTRPPGAPTITVVSPAAVNDSSDPGAESGPNKRTQRAWSGSRPATGTPRARRTVASASGDGPIGAPTAVSSATWPP